MMVRNFNNDQSKYNKRKRTDFRSAIITERFLTVVLRVSACPRITKRAIFINIQKFMSQVNPAMYEKDPNVYALIVAINVTLKNRIEGVDTPEDLVEYINLEIMDNYEEQKQNIIFPTILAAEEATDKEKNLVLNTIDTYITFQAVLERKDDLADAITDIGSGNISNLNDAMDSLRNIVSGLHEEFQKANISKEAYTFVHTSERQEFKDILEDAHAYAISDKVCLHTGLKRFNEMLSTKGGFLGGKFYMFYADTNTFKSALLKYCCKWIQKYNGNTFKEEFLATGKRPCILYISLEDGVKEDTSRLFTTYTGKDLMSEENFEEAEKLWEEEYMASGSDIDICQVNSAESPINLATIEGFKKRLEEEGYFLIAIVVDSFDLMAPSDDDIYRGITDDTTIFSNRAKAIQKWIADKPFPWITAHQLNRAGNQYLMEKKEKGCVDLAKTLGRSFISGAYDIERRVHWSAFIYTEWSHYDNELYLEIHREKVKYKKTPVDYLVQWLQNGFIIHDDYGTDQYNSRDTIMPKDENINFTQGAADVGVRGITSIAKMKGDMGIKDNNTPQSTASTAPQPMTFEQETTPIQNTSNLPSLMTAIPNVFGMNFFSVDVPTAFTYSNPFEMNNYKVAFQGDDTVEYIMPDVSYGVTPFNC